MRLRRRKRADVAKGDMTPMIDMTFQLIAFFMVVINFSKADQNKIIHLPASELAKPPDQPLESSITLQVTTPEKGRDGEALVIFGARQTKIDGLQRLLLRQVEVIQSRDSLADATVIIRADGDAKTGTVQKVIQECQKAGFQNFALRARHKKQV